MTIEDVFAIRGRRTVATGQVESGQLRAGDEVLVNGTMSVTVDAIEAFSKQLTEANVGDDIGVLLRRGASSCFGLRSSARWSPRPLPRR